MSYDEKTETKSPSLVVAIEIQKGFEKSRVSLCNLRLLDSTHADII